MSISFNTDYSTLFGSYSSSNSSSSSLGFYANLSDYSLIKSGAYKNLMKAYYSQSDSKSNSAVNSIVGSKLASQDSTTEIQKLQSASSALSKSASALTTDKKNTLYDEGNEDKLLKAVSSFVKDYNSMVDAADSSENSKVLRAGSNMLNNTASNYKMLSSVGISIGADNKLSLDEEAFKKADASTVKTLFNGTGSFANRTASYASYIDMYAKSDAASASGLYGASATYSSLLNGSTYNSYT